MTPPSAAATADAPVPDNKPAEPAEPILEHSYDGIREYDNPLPGWWRATFYASIVFAAIYFVWFHVVGWGTTPQETYEVKLAAYHEKRELREAADARDVSEESLARAALDPKQLDKGAQVFATRCASCHADDGRGLIGPNLTDGYQLHGTTRMDILKTVRMGVPGTAMLAWSDQLAAGDIVAVTAFVTSLRGKNIAGKEPQGQPVGAFQ